MFVPAPILCYNKCRDKSYWRCIMNIIQSVFLGIVQGITEFLPVSSSGHLAILQNLFHINTESTMLFDILLHIGTLAAVFTVYHKDIRKMITAFFQIIGNLFFNLRIFFLNRIHKTSLKYRRVVHNNYQKFVVLIFISTIPTALIGFAGRELVSAASSTLLIPGICLLMTGVLLLIADNSPEGRKVPKDISAKNAILIGIAQGFSTLPGLSRSGTTITACLLCGMDRRFAVKYSFLLSVPAVLGAAVLELRDAAAEPLSASALGVSLAGMVTAAVVGYISIKTLLILVRGKKFKYFSYYCFAAGVLAIAGYFLI